MADHITFIDQSTASTNLVPAAWFNDVNDSVYQGKNPSFVTSTGSANAYIVTLPSSTLTALETGQEISFKANFTNSGAATLELVGSSSTSAIAIQQAQAALSSGTITALDVVTVTYANSVWNISSVTSASGASTFSAITVTGNATVGGTLGVTGLSTLASLTVTGATTLNSLTVNGTTNLVKSTFLLNYISGFTYANNVADATNDLDIAAGACRDATNAVDIVGTALTKQSDVAWAVGTAAGMLDTGVVGNSDYYIWAIKRSDTSVVDYLSSLSSTAPTMPASYDYKRLIGWFKRVGGTIVAFHVYEIEGGGIYHLWDAPTLDVNLANTLTTTRRTDAMKVPLNFSTIAHINAATTDVTVGNQTWICCPDQTSAASSQTIAPLNNLGQVSTIMSGMGNQLHIRTSATGTIASINDVATVDLYVISTMGFSWGRRN